MDKNFLVPVGGAVVLGQQPLIKSLASLYPGRASIAPILDLFITLLQMGKTTLTQLLTTRKELFQYSLTQFNTFSSQINEQVLDTHQTNRISIALTLN